MQPVGPRVIVPPEAGLPPPGWWQCYGWSYQAVAAQRRMSYQALQAAWFKNARFRVTLGISARTLIGPALERVYATPG